VPSGQWLVRGWLRLAVDIQRGTQSTKRRGYDGNPYIKLLLLYSFLDMVLPSLT